MREIKFRAWDKKEKRMFTNTELVLIENYKCTSMIANELIGIGDDTLKCRKLVTENIILMQYTNFKDCNGIEIYEGDIVEIELHRKRFGKYKVEVMIENSSVIFRKGKEIVPLFIFQNGKAQMQDLPSRGVVIGNRYENKKLLKLIK